jgi:DNA replication protein DnaC
MSVLQPALHDSLRALRLSGMLETLDARLAQATAGQLGHLDFLQVLCQDEISRRESMSITRRIRQARFDEQNTLEGFDFAVNPKVPAAQIRDLAALRWLHAAESVILYGPVGVGKTHVAQALGHLAIRTGEGAGPPLLVTPRRMLGVFTSTTKEAPGGSVRGTAVRGDRPASAAQRDRADDGGG